MKAVPAYAFVGETARQAEQLGQSGLAVVERGVEAGDLRDLRRRLLDRLDDREVEGLVQRRQRFERMQIGQHLGVDADGRRKARAAVHDPVSDPHHRRAAVQPGEQRQDLARRRLLIELLGPPALFGDDLAPRVDGAQARRDADLLDLAAEQQIFGCSGRVKRELDAGGTRVDDGDASVVRRRHGIRRRHRSSRP